jgi:DNA-binding IscR family transcriptional regulator
MLFTKKLEYGYILLKAMKDCTRENPKMGKDIISELDIPQKMAKNILTILSNHELIATTRGEKRGYYINKKNITLYDLFLALEGEQKIKIKYNDHEYENLIKDMGLIFFNILKNTILI